MVNGVARMGQIEKMLFEQKLGEGGVLVCVCLGRTVPGRGNKYREPQITGPGVAETQGGPQGSCG